MPHSSSPRGAGFRRRFSFPSALTSLTPFSSLSPVMGLFALACALQLWTACNKKDPNADPKVLAGRGVYIASCSACHNMNPERDGSLGPAVKGSSLELLQARVLRAEYPPGYTPKRATKMMVKLPLMEADVENLHAFLNAP